MEKKVFTSEFIYQLKQRYEKPQCKNKPDLYYVATSPRKKCLRDKIESLVNCLPQNKQEDVIKKIRDTKSSEHTYHELIVGDSLRQRGYNIEYEKCVCGKRLDWYICGKDEIPDFIIEVFTKEMTEKKKQWEKAISNILENVHNEKNNIVFDAYYNINDNIIDKHAQNNISVLLNSGLKMRK